MRKKWAKNKEQNALYKMIPLILTAYVILAVLFFYLADDQLHYRDAKGNLELPPCNAATIELVQGTMVEQFFQTNIQRLEEISVQIGTYYRQNQGTLKIELYDFTKHDLLAESQIDVSELIDLGVVTLELPAAFEHADHMLLIRIYSLDGVAGASVAPMMNTEIAKENFVLCINGQETQGTLCFVAEGTDYIWIGQHYWQVVLMIGCLIFLYLCSFLYKVQHHKNSYLLQAVVAVKKYKFLIKQLIARDFKTKYKRSILGILWSFLNPLLMMIVQYIVFSTIFKTDIEYYPVYLLTGIVMFNYFSETCGMALMSILGNASLITKVYMPKYIYPLSRVLSSAVNLLISLLPLLCVIVFVGVPVTKAYILLVIPLFCMILFCLGLGMLLSASMVFFRDTQFLWGVLSTIWMYATPIFYPISILPENFKFVLTVNPLYYFITFARTCILQGVSPDPILYGQCFAFAIGMFVIGVVVFKKTQDKFILAL